MGTVATDLPVNRMHFYKTDIIIQECNSAAAQESFDAHYILQITSETCDYSRLILNSVHVMLSVTKW